LHDTWKLDNGPQLIDRYGFDLVRRVHNELVAMLDAGTLRVRRSPSGLFATSLRNAFEAERVAALPSNRELTAPTLQPTAPLPNIGSQDPRSDDFSRAYLERQRRRGLNV